MIRHPRQAVSLPRLCRHIAAIAAAAGAAIVAPSAAAQGTIGRDAQRIYQQEAAGCRGSARQDRATCMREAAAARAEARRGQLARPGADYAANAAQRCNALPDADRQDCLMRVHGEGKTSGSVEGGGIYRETATRTPARVLPSPRVPLPRAADTTPGAPQN